MVGWASLVTTLFPIKEQMTWQSLVGVLLLYDLFFIPSNRIKKNVQKALEGWMNHICIICFDWF